jgi:aryl-alcohol dehydrogenase-like predicted oxidoreductase
MDIAKDHNITPAQLALAWLLHQGEDIFPIPGTRKSHRVDENNQALNIELDESTLNKINELAKPGLTLGETLV